MLPINIIVITYIIKVLANAKRHALFYSILLYISIFMVANIDRFFLIGFYSNFVLCHKNFVKYILFAKWDQVYLDNVWKSNWIDLANKM